MDVKMCRDFHSYFEDAEHLTPTIQAYRAVSEAMLAQVVWNPFSKLSQVMKYDKQMEAAVNSDPENIEIRFLRLAIEYNLPSFLGMSTHIEEDIDVILENMTTVNSLEIDPGYGQYIFWFLETSELCTPDQVMAMKETLTRQTSF